MDRRYGRMMRRVLAVGLALLAGGALAGAVTLQEEVTPLGSLQEGAKFDQMKVGRDGWCVYVVQRGKQFAVVTGETVGKLYDEIKELDAVARGTVVYAARTGKTWRLVKDGVEGPEFTDLKEVELSQDGQRLAYAGQRGKQWVVVLDGAEVKTYDDVPLILFGPQGQRFAYAAIKGKAAFIVVDGEESEAYDGVRGLAFSRDGTRFVYGVIRGKGAFVVVDGVPGPTFEDVTFGNNLFSPDGTRVGYVAMRSGEPVVVTDGQVSDGYVSVQNLNPAFSPDGKHVAYVAMTEKPWLGNMFIDGVRITPPQDEKGRWPLRGWPRWSPDSKRVACWALDPGVAWIKSRWQLIIDNVRLYQYQNSSRPGVGAFSPGSSRYAVDIPVPKNQRSMLVDSSLGKELYDDLISYHFTDESTIEGVARRGLQLVKFVVRISP